MRFYDIDQSDIQDWKLKLVTVTHFGRSNRYRICMFPSDARSTPSRLGERIKRCLAEREHSVQRQTQPQDADR